MGPRLRAGLPLCGRSWPGEIEFAPLVLKGMGAEKLSPLKWNSNYSVGLPELDREHQQLFQLLDALEQIRAKGDPVFVGKVVNTLIEYVKQHFFHEETVMKNIGYPELESHRKQHRSFIDKAYDFRESFEKNQGEELVPRIIEFLRTWLATHILIHDKAYEKYIRQTKKMT